MQPRKKNYRAGFTVVELIVVISIIAILATIVTLSFGAWRNSTIANQVKSDLINAASTMESARNFGTGYPLSLPTNFTPSENVEVVLAVAFSSEFCLEAQPVDNTSPDARFYLYSKLTTEGPKNGTCDDRPSVAPPEPPTPVTAIASSGTTAAMSWPSVVGATSYVAQCALDAAFILSPKEVTAPSASGTINAVINGLTPTTTFFCRAKAVNDKGSSPWSDSVSVNTNGSYGSLPIASSIEGYWTSAPQGYLLEDGSAVSRTEYDDLFAVIGTTYGAGDGSTTFNLPDSRGRTSVNRNTSDSEFTTIGQKSGTKTQTLTTAQLPSHTHTGTTGMGNAIYGRVVYLGGSGVASNHLTGFGGGYLDRNDAGYALANHRHNFTSNATGSGQAHENVQPSIVKMSAIKYAPVDVSAPELPAGTSISGYWTTIPSGYLAENGAAVSRITYDDLFDEIGVTYGNGNGSSTFTLPNSQGKASLNYSNIDPDYDLMGESLGSKLETLSIAQIPGHTHTGTTGSGNAMPYRVVHQVGSGTAGDHIAGWSGANGYADYTWSNYPLALHTHSFTSNATGSGTGHNEIQPSITKLYAIKHTSSSESTPLTVPTGTSVASYDTTVPSGYLYEDGSAVSRSTYSALFGVIGSTYGDGDGTTTFNLPDSRGRIGVIRDPGDADFDEMGDKYGVKSVSLTIGQLPSHTHTGTTGSGNAMWYRTVTGAGGSTVHDHITGWTGGPYTDFNDANYQGAVHTHNFTTNSTGSGGSHDNLQPSIVKRFMIKI